MFYSFHLPINNLSHDHSKFYIRKYYKLVSSYADISRKSVECISMQPKQMEWLISLYGSLISLTGLSVLAYQAIKTL